MLTSTSIGFRLLAVSCLVTLSALVEEVNGHRRTEIDESIR